MASYPAMVDLRPKIPPNSGLLLAPLRRLTATTSRPLPPCRPAPADTRRCLDPLSRASGSGCDGCECDSSGGDDGATCEVDSWSGAGGTADEKMSPRMTPGEVRSASRCDAESDERGLPAVVVGIVKERGGGGGEKGEEVCPFACWSPCPFAHLLLCFFLTACLLAFPHQILHWLPRGRWCLAAGC